VGLVPTGASDPYALRRQGIGIVQIMIDKGFGFSLIDAVEESLGLYEIEKDDTLQAVSERVIGFLKNRISRMLVESGHAKDIVNAVTHASVDPVPDVWKRVQALEALKTHADFSSLAGTFKRVGNIIRKAGVADIGTVQSALFAEKSEASLYAAAETTAEEVRRHLADGDFDGALLKVAELKSAVDTFFDDVMVMAEDRALRNNRLALLGQVAGLFDQFADFSRIAT
jgi:glycyl-tRNA synthetase beta chain